MDGYGEYMWPNNVSYKGHYKNNQRHGNGIMQWNIYKMWRGSWAFGFRHGYGETI